FRSLPLSLSPNVHCALFTFHLFFGSFFWGSGSSFPMTLCIPPSFPPGFSPTLFSPLSCSLILLHRAMGCLSLWAVFSTNAVLRSATPLEIECVCVCVTGTAAVVCVCVCV